VIGHRFSPLEISFAAYFSPEIAPILPTTFFQPSLMFLKSVKPNL
jgi:hypothetical protein